METECVPAVSVEIERVAVPLLTVPVPIEVKPSKNVTVPLASLGTWAVNTIICPKVLGLVADVTLIAPVALLTTWLKTGEVLASKSRSPA
jgi:hypothetical protein